MHCFIYYKKDFQLSKYLKEERDKLRKKFKNRLNYYFNRHAKQYITKYKGTDYNNKFNLKSTNNSIKALIIDIKLLLSLIQEQTKLFLTFFKIIQHEGAINTITDLTD